MKRPAREARRLGAGLLLALAATGCGGGDASGPPSVLLVSIDTLRADHLGVYGHTGARTPVLDGLAARGTRFETAISPTPITLPSHSSLMTGQTPPYHGVRDNGAYRLATARDTLAERFRGAGYATGAFVGAHVLDASFGLDQGFDVYDDVIGGERSSAVGYAERRAGAVVEKALAWLAGVGERPFFAWVHLYDPHGNYDPPTGFAAAFPNRPYDGEIAYVDFQVGRLLEALEARGLARTTLAVVTSDHGESLGEHGEPTHTRFVYDATQRIPLILAGPGVPPGRVVEQPVRLWDVAPTILELAGLSPLAAIQGSSLAPLLRDEPAPTQEAYLETLATRAMGWSPLLGWRTADEKYVRAPRPELYDLHADPRELENLAAVRPERVAELDTKLAAYLSGAPAPGPRAGLDPESRRRLEALGYVVSDAPLGETIVRVGGIDPKDVIDQAARFDLAASHFGAGNLVEAVRIAATLREEVPEARLYLLFEATLRARLGDVDASAELIQRAIALEPNEASSWVLLAETEAARGRPEAARAALDRAFALDPEEPGALQAAVVIAVESGRPADGWERLAALPPEKQETAEIRTLRARLLEAEGRGNEVRALYEQVLAEVPSHPGAQLRLALLELRDGRIEEGARRLEEVAFLSSEGLRTAHEIALAYAAGGAPERALETLRPFVEQGTRSAPVLEAYGALLLGLGRTAEAEAALREALALAPGHLRAANNLASLLAAEARDLDQALALAEAVHAAAPGATSADTLAEVHLARGEPERAVAVLDEALERGAGTARLRSLRSRALAALGRDPASP